MVSRHDYLPFGEEIPVNYGGRTTGMGYQANPALTQRFTGKERDTETGLDYFGARYLSSVQGRWSSADAPFADQQTEDPQSWNLYSYVRNQPLSSVDRDGRIAETLWDAFNIGIGVVSLVDNVSKGNYGDAAWDAGGLLLDTAATFVPFVPGGAGAVIKGARVANKIDNAVDTANAARNADRAKGAANVGKTSSQELRRPYVRKDVRKQVEATAPKTADGKFLDPNTGRPIEGKYDLGHKPGHEFRRDKAAAQKDGITQKEFNDRMNDPNKYQIEDPSSNRSRRYEQNP